MTQLTQASRQLFARPPDECFETLPDLFRFCQDLKDRSTSAKKRGTDIRTLVQDGHLVLRINGNPPYALNDWSFTQLCSLAGVSKDTVNRLKPDTAMRVFTETLADRVSAETDVQALVKDNRLVRALNGARYTRLWSADLVSVLLEYAVDFTPPQKGFNGATGLYAGEQDLFAFMIDPTGWIEIEDQAFAPGFFVWNSEVGRRTVGISTFWFQAVCCNHIVWDATEVFEFARKHTGDVQGSLAVVRASIEALVKKRDDRKDRFAQVIAEAMTTTFGQDAEDAMKLLAQAGFTRMLAKQALEIAAQKGRFTIWSVVDALTQLARERQYAGSRTELDAKASALLEMARKY